MRPGIVRLARVATVAVLAPLAVSSVAHAADLSISLDTVIDAGVAEGGQVELTTVAADVLAGQSCVMRAVHGSDEAHRDNDLIVTSGDGTATLVDVEREPGAITEGSGPLILGEEIRVDLVMGADEQFSGDVMLELECDGTAPGTAAAPSADPPDLPITGPWSMTIGVVLGTLFVMVGCGLTVLARPTERS
jgi:hypothetical protein